MAIFLAGRKTHTLPLTQDLFTLVGDQGQLAVEDIDIFFRMGVPVAQCGLCAGLQFLQVSTEVAETPDIA